MKTIYTVNEIKKNLSNKKYVELSNIAKYISKNELNKIDKKFNYNTWKNILADIKVKNYESNQLYQDLLVGHILFPNEIEIINLLISGFTREEFADLNNPEILNELNKITNYKGYNLDMKSVLINRINEIIALRGILFLNDQERLEITNIKIQIANILKDITGIYSLEYDIDILTNPITVNAKIIYDNHIIKNINEIVTLISNALNLSNSVIFNIDISPLQKEVYVLDDKHIIRKLINQK